MKDFKIEKTLGKGTFGNVYLVTRIEDQKIYALKSVILEKLSKKEQENSLNEVRILASINHPNVIGYKETFWDDETNSLNIVMEYADEGDLQTKITKMQNNNKKFDEIIIWSYAIQIIEGLKSLHDKKIMHRDLKSANIFLFKEKNICKIGDMNVSIILKEKLSKTQTGTPYYASPEIWMGLPYSYKSDLWSAGCIIYELCELQPPFLGNNLDDLFINVCKGGVKRINENYSDDLWKMISMLLQIDADKRVDCDEFLNSELIKNKINEMITNDIMYEFLIFNQNDKCFNKSELLNSIKFKDIKDIKEQLPNKKNYDNKKMFLISELKRELEIEKIKAEERKKLKKERIENRLKKERNEMSEEKKIIKEKLRRLEKKITEEKMKTNNKNNKNSKNSKNNKINNTTSNFLISKSQVLNNENNVNVNNFVQNEKQYNLIPKPVTLRNFSYNNLKFNKVPTLINKKNFNLYYLNKLPKKKSFLKINLSKPKQMSLFSHIVKPRNTSFSLRNKIPISISKPTEISNLNSNTNINFMSTKNKSYVNLKFDLHRNNFPITKLYKHKQFISRIPNNFLSNKIKSEKSLYSITNKPKNMINVENISNNDENCLNTNINNPNNSFKLIRKINPTKSKITSTNFVENYLKNKRKLMKKNNTDPITAIRKNNDNKFKNLNLNISLFNNSTNNYNTIIKNNITQNIYFNKVVKNNVEKKGINVEKTNRNNNYCLITPKYSSSSIYNEYKSSCYYNSTCGPVKIINIFNNK